MVVGSLPRLRSAQPTPLSRAREGWPEPSGSSRGESPASSMIGPGLCLRSGFAVTEPSQANIGLDAVRDWVQLLRSRADTVFDHGLQVRVVLPNLRIGSFRGWQSQA
jgi:hypothetical protein